MQVQIGQKPKDQPVQQQAPQKASVVISSNPIRIREMLDKDGNVIDPRTKQIIRKADDNK